MPHKTIVEPQKALWNQHGISQILTEPSWNFKKHNRTITNCYNALQNHYRTSKSLGEPSQNLTMPCTTSMMPLWNLIKPPGTIVEPVQNHHGTSQCQNYLTEPHEASWNHHRTSQCVTKPQITIAVPKETSQNL